MCQCEYLIKIKCSVFVFVGNVVDIYQREFLALRDRLHSAEQENLKRSKELNLVLDEIKRAIAEKQVLRDINRTWSSLSGETGTRFHTANKKDIRSDIGLHFQFYRDEFILDN